MYGKEVLHVAFFPYGSFCARQSRSFFSATVLSGFKERMDGGSGLHFLT